MRFDLIDLKLFVHIAESGSITAGAKLAHLSLPSASARVHGMEEGLNLALLERGRRGAEPTEAGRALLHHARAIARQLDDMRADLAQFGSGLKRQVRLLCNTSAMTEFLPEALAGFLAGHPQLSIDLEERLSRDIVRAVTDGAADIGIVTDAVDSAALQTLPFRDDPLVLVMARKHPLAQRIGKGRGKRRGVLFADTLDQDFIGLAGDSALQQYAAEQASRLGREMHCKIRLRSFEAVCRMVASGAGVAILPEAAARRSADPEALRVVALNDDWADRKLLICVRDHAALPLHVRELVAALRRT
ncbi:ModE molybdate transport repressor domain-containing protein [Duganella sp. CF517]|uniref:LysR substrate-binding domain-containing protein n=1 Tax=Duganella sp. CF517 TaxID=1881038 RepID=UPI0008D05CCA|nr:LysR substrate-binding domain-containing protein [Duganella sp. CF517]SEN24424.1 ModE molybdate transport repressor domain-containing protein [Duganella sp. CF517]